MIWNGTNHAIVRHVVVNQLVYGVSARGLVIPHGTNVMPNSKIVVPYNTQTGQYRSLLVQGGSSDRLKST